MVIGTKEQVESQLTPASRGRGNTPFSGTEPKKDEKELVDVTSADSFPASDPPSWNMGEGDTEKESQRSEQEKPSTEKKGVRPKPDSPR